MEMVIKAIKAITTSLIMVTSHIKVIKAITTIAGLIFGTIYGIDMKLAPGLTLSLARTIGLLLFIPVTPLTHETLHRI